MNMPFGALDMSAILLPSIVKIFPAEASCFDSRVEATPSVTSSKSFGMRNEPVAHNVVHSIYVALLADEFLKINSVIEEVSQCDMPVTVP